MTQRRLLALPLLLVVASLFVAGCAERYESVDDEAPYYEGGEDTSPPACPGSGTPTDLETAPRGPDPAYECPSGNVTSHPQGEAAGDPIAAQPVAEPASV